MCPFQLGRSGGIKAEMAKSGWQQSLGNGITTLDGCSKVSKDDSQEARQKDPETHLRQCVCNLLNSISSFPELHTRTRSTHWRFAGFLAAFSAHNGFLVPY